MLLSGKACADTEPRVKAEFPHPPHAFRDFDNLIALDSAAELFKWTRPPVRLARLSSLSAYRVCQIRPNPPAVTTASQTACHWIN